MVDKNVVRRFALNALLFFIFVCIIVYRRPDSISNPQFWAEDGRVWYANAYNYGWNFFFKPQDGYLQTLSRIIAAFAQFFPLIYGPLIFNIVAVIVQTLPPFLFTTNRVKKYIPSSGLRWLIICIYFLLPNMGELYINLTNAYWYLALSAFIVLSFRQKFSAFDLIILLLSGLSGPLCIFMFPIFLVSDLIQSWSKKANHMAPQTVLYGMTAIAQIVSLFSSKGIDRVNVPAQTSFSLLVDIVEKQIIWGSLAGLRGQIFIQKYLSSFSDEFYHLTTLVALSLVIFALIKGHRIVRQFIAFSILVFISVLIIRVSWASWSNSYELRYWLIPMLAFQSTLVWCLYYKNPRIIRITGGVFIAVYFFFCVRNYRFYEFFRYGPYTDLDFASHAKTFEELPAGETLTIPINPVGWKMTLNKK